ncbi:MAG: PAS domain S-box protein [Ignavibacteria bacterium]
MKKKEPVKPHAESLRKKAIEPVKKKSKGINPVHSEADVLKLIHELEVHKIELELQNEETKKRADELLIANENLTKVEHHLRGRNKELQALYALSQLAEGTELSMESLFRKVLYILINAWQHPEFICSRIVVDGVAYCSENFAPTKWKQSAPVIVNGNIIGSMDVLYMKKMKKEDEGPFLKEERNLINALAERLGHIIEHKRADEKKRNDDTLIRTLSTAIEQSTVTTVITDIEGNIEFVNPMFTEVTGYTFEEAAGRNHRMLKSGNKSKEDYKKLWDTILSGKVWRGEFCNKKKNGKLYYESAVISPVKNEEGTIIKYLALKEDITEQKETEQEIKRQSALITSLIDSIPDVVFFKDKEGAYIAANPAFELLMGMPKSKFIGKADHDFFDKKIADALRADDLKTMEQAAPHRYEEWITIKDRKSLFETIKKPYRDGTGEIIGILGISRDITERKEAETKLKESEERFETLAEHSRVITWEIDANGLYTYISDVCRTVLGYNPEEIIGKKHFYDLHPEEGRETFKSEVFGFLMQKKLVRGHINPLENKEGKVVWVSTNALPTLFSDGKLMGCRGTDTDVTERKEALEQIKQKNKELLELNSEKDMFFSIIAHDLRGPFNGFLGLTDVFVSELTTMSIEEIQKLAVMMKESANNLYRFLENLLEWSQMNRGLTIVNPNELSIHNIIHDNIRLIKDQATIKEIEISTDVPEGMTVFADKYMLETVLRNLLSNAVKYTKKGGSIAVSARNTTDKLIEVSVTDTGIGMNKEMIHDLFRIDAKTSRKGTDGESSTGLGLLICREFIEKNEGILTVDSKEGKGSTFRVSLPSCEEIPTTESLKPEKNNEGKLGNLKILIAEDDRVSAKLLSRELYNMSKEMFTAESGVEAVEICRSNPDIDVVIMDIRMPLMDGYEAAKKIREYNKDIVIIAKVTFALTDHAKKAKESGFNDTIINIFDIQLLEETIAKHIR